MPSVTCRIKIDSDTYRCSICDERFHDGDIIEVEEGQEGWKFDHEDCDDPQGGC